MDFHPGLVKPKRIRASDLSVFQKKYLYILSNRNFLALALA